MGSSTGRIRGRSTWVRPVLAGLAVAALALAALALRTAPGPAAWLSQGPLAQDSGLVWLLAFGGAVGGAAVAGRHRKDVKEYGTPTPVAERLATVASFLLPLAAGLAPLIIFLLPDSPGPPPAAEPSGDNPPPPPPPYHDGGARGGASNALLAVAIAVLVLAVVVALVLLWRRFGHHLRRRVALRPEAAGTAPIRARALADAIDSGLRALHGDDVRAAVIACYAALESSLADSGVIREESDSPADLLRRAAVGGVLAGPYPQILAALFREARYSGHPMDHDHLHRARAALDAISAQLAEPQHAESRRAEPQHPEPTPAGSR
ncbi:DUF4129 domain-containing protein [Kitasatospora sp. MAP5-34]|uniref:DUF4129 domain-containing protein n=1 Tax=Kitasatospora sp. MAP5-34 TaxID=3035102 RepID=UPI002475C657|nr:DUF4129 domain-containing protein [Kitasatospora sp. MAP5-34]MDH6579136.1 hypothetical protein [Kitasatospora sp. MAP5-34]